MTAMRLLVTLFLCCTWISSAYAEDRKLKIGAIVPLTGPAADYGTALQNGAQLAASEHPEKFRSLEIKWEDSRLDSTTALSAYRKLTSIDKVDLIFVWGVAPASAIAPLTVKLGIPMIAITADRSVSVGRPNVFRFHYHFGLYAKPLAEYFNHQQLKSLALVKTQLAYFDGVLEELKAQLNSSIKIDSIAEYQLSNNDFRSAILKIKSGAYDGILVFLVPGQISAFHQQAHSYGLQKPAFGVDFYDSLNEMNASGANAIGAIFPAFAVNENFRDRYVRRFGIDFQLPYAANTFDVFNFLAERLAQSPNSEGASLVEALKTAPPYSGVSGNYHYVESTAGSGFDVEVVLKQVKKDKIDYLEGHNK